MKSKLLRRSLLSTTLLLGLAGCLPDEGIVAPVKPHELQRIGDSTYLIEQRTGKVFTLREGRFVEIQKVDLASQSTSFASRRIVPFASQGMVYDVQIKYIDNNILYKIYIEGQRAGQRRITDIAVPDANPPALFVDRPYAVADWKKRFEQGDNRLFFSFIDSDEFSVNDLSLRLDGVDMATDRTRIVDDNGDAIGFRFEGSFSGTATSFERIKNVRIRWNFSNANPNPNTPRR